MGLVFFFLVKSLLVYESTKLILSTTREMNLDHWLLLDYLLTLMIVDVLQLGHRFDVASDYWHFLLGSWNLELIFVMLFVEAAIEKCN